MVSELVIFLATLRKFRRYFNSRSDLRRVSHSYEPPRTGEVFELRCLVESTYIIVLWTYWKTEESRGELNVKA